MRFVSFGKYIENNLVFGAQASMFGIITAKKMMKFFRMMFYKTR